LSKIISVHSVT